MACVILYNFTVLSVCASCSRCTVQYNRHVSVYGFCSFVLDGGEMMNMLITSGLVANAI
jgi:hypothetical protein